MNLVGIIRPPERLSAEHDISEFDSSEPALDEWLRRPARQTEVAGMHAILVHAISETAKQFYEKYGFVASPVDPSPVDPQTVMITLAEAVKMLAPAP